MLAPVIVHAVEWIVGVRRTGLIGLADLINYVHLIGHLISLTQLVARIRFADRQITTHRIAASRRSDLGMSASLTASVIFYLVSLIGLADRLMTVLKLVIIPLVQSVRGVLIGALVGAKSTGIARVRLRYTPIANVFVAV